MLSLNGKLYKLLTMKHYFLIISAIICILFSCKKEDEPGPDYPSCRLIKEIQKYSYSPNDTIYPYYEYVYEGNNLVKRLLYTKYIFGTFEDSITGPGVYLIPELIDSFIYKDGKVYENYRYRNRTSSATHQRFFYSGDKLEKISTVFYFNLKVISTKDESFEYNNDGTIVKSLSISENSDGEIQTTTKTFNYQDQNLSRIDIAIAYTQDTNYKPMIYFSDTTTYSFEEFNNYDSNENPYRQMFFIDDLRNKSISKNNYAHYQEEMNYRNGYSRSESTNEIVGSNLNGFPLHIGFYELIYECDN
jgi:hypothetical protein